MWDNNTIKAMVVYGDEETGKTRLLDRVMTLQFISSEDGDGFTTTLNNYETGSTPQFVDGKALLSTGLVKNTTDLTTKTYTVRMWIDSSKVFVSSTTKRSNNAEGYPRIAARSNGRVLANRYIKNDTNLMSIYLYPANSEQEGKIIYTTNEFKNAYYSIKIAVKAEDIVNNVELVYFDANGGTINIETKNVKVGETYGEFPITQKDGYTLLGWKINETDVDYVSPSTVVTLSRDHVLKAIWQKNL